MRPFHRCLIVLTLALGACARTSPGDAENPATLSNGLYAVLAEGTDEATAAAAAGTAPHVVLINDGRYTGATDEPTWLALSPEPYVPLILAGEPVLGQSEKGFASLELALAPESAQVLEDFTAEHLNGTVAIVIGGDVVTKHKVKAVITGGRMQITRCTDNACETLRTMLLEP